MKTRVFISFSIPFDLGARNRLYSESLRPGSNVSVSYWSVTPGIPHDQWEEETRRHIGCADLLVALVGANARRAPNIRDEVRIARELGKTVLAVRVDDEPDPPENVTELYEWADLDEILLHDRS